MAFDWNFLTSQRLSFLSYSAIVTRHLARRKYPRATDV